MEMATAHQPLLAATHIQALGMDPMLYHSRCSAWQPVVASLPSITEIPKESIIANTDFTTTSVLAKRRLSSKKRRKQNQDICGGEGTGYGSECSNWSPGGSSSGPGGSSSGSPSTASNSCTPVSVERSDMNVITHRDLTSQANVQSQCLSDVARVSQSSMAVSASSSHEELERRNRYMAEVATSTMPNSTHQSTAMGIVHGQQITNSVLSQIQQGLNYRYLQEQSMLQQQAVHLSTAVAPVSQIAHPLPLINNAQQAPSHKTVCSEFDGSKSGFKWCMAHVVIAKQIQQHKQQQQRKGETVFPIHLQQDSPPSHNPQQQPHHVQQHQQQAAPLTSNTQPFPPQHTSTAPAITSAPHLTFMQYNLPNNTVVATAAPPPAATGYPPGYLAVPYSSMQELQLRMQQSLLPIPTQLHLSNGLQVMKPMMTMSDNVVGLNLGVQMVGGLPPTMQQPQLAGIATCAPIGHTTASSSAAMVQGPATIGSWVTPVHGVNSCVFNNPFQPGIMATPWVK